jgi:formate hydrogenlyase subunit 3/multisubunit Na+/H+ antiporter MnhD subunit
MYLEPFLLLMILIITSAPLIYLAGRLQHRLPTRLPGRLSAWLAIIVLLVGWIPLSLAASRLFQSGPTAVYIGTIPMRFDGLSLLLSGLVLALGTLVVLFSIPYMAGEYGEEKFYAMLVTMIGVMIALSCAADLFNLWIWFEAMAISSYLLVMFYRQQPASLEAGVKYVVQSAAGSVLVLMGIALVLMQTGALQFTLIHKAATATPILLAAGALFMIGFGVKTALVPLHTWLPDAHSQAPSGISAMLSGVVIEAGLVAMLRSIGPLAGLDGQGYSPATWGVLLIGLGALNMIIGNLMALRQTQVKRLLAYSSLSHVGYMIFGLGAALYAGSLAGAQGSLAGAQGGMFHLLNHGLMKGLAFLAAGALLYAITSAAATTQPHLDPQDQSHGPLTIADLGGAAQRYPLAALAFSLALLGLGGLPPLAGFMSKWQIFVGGFDTHNAWIIALAVFAALNSVLSLAYYAPLVNGMYRKETSSAVRSGAAIPVQMSLPLLLLSLAVVLLGLWPSLAAWITAPAGQAVLSAFGL